MELPVRIEIDNRAAGRTTGRRSSGPWYDGTADEEGENA
jgi:hypothetical protein